MGKNKYFEIILAKLGSLSRHFKFIVFIFFIVFLFYVFTLSIRISSAIGHIPSPEDIDKKIPAVQIRKCFISRIKQLVYVRQGNRYAQSDHNPFLPYQSASNPDTGSLESSPAASPDISASSDNSTTAADNNAQP